ncbi:MAG: PLP-dependent aminotransferase family protein [Pyrinomonadaceae bacterium]
MTAPFLAVTFDARAGVPLYRQLYEELRARILSKQLPAAARLPSTRDLARESGVSRNTVMNAFAQLLAEGYIEGQTGSGTYVSRALPDEMLRARAPWLNGDAPRPDASPRNLSQRGEALARMSVTTVSAGLVRETRPFRPGVPAFDEFPFPIWSRLLAKHWRRPRRELLTYGDAAGYAPLREAIANYLRVARAARCEAAQVIVTDGMQQAFDLAARVLVDPGDRVWIEDPGYLAARAALAGAGARLVPVRVDAEGLDVTYGARHGAGARLVYVTPSHQYPTGVTMTLARRLALLEWAGRAGAWILEDDYDGEYRYAGRPLASLQGLDRAGRVIYLGTFSKVVFPALRLGYMIVPADLVPSFTNARAVAARFSPTVEQAALADFIGEGHFTRHLRRMRALYAARQETLVAAARRWLGGLLEISPDGAGIHLVGWLPEGHDDAAASRAAAARGIDAQPLSAFTIKSRHSPRGGLVLGYAAYRPRQLREGVRALAAALQETMSDE